MFVAHTKRLPDGQLAHHPLEDHLLATARLAAANAALFGARTWAELAGRWHDLGKYRPGFQRYVAEAGDPDAHIEGRMLGRDKTHSAAGALWADRRLRELAGGEGAVAARVLQYLIAGHHAGLDNWTGGLKERLAGADAGLEFDQALAALPSAAILDPGTDLPAVSDIKADRPGEIPGRFALWVRMLFSCLVDADFLDTEAFMDADKAERRAGAPGISELAARLEAHMTEVVSRSPPTPVNRVRNEVLRQCRSAALRSPGVFTLTVPTGGGKTLSSAVFALAHAAVHGKRRVIYAIPYTSIIEQTAEVFRDVFGDASVVEHHSNVESTPDRETHRSRLACENWDAPLIVTTNVQLFESLFARRTSRCRKLHNIAGSVIVLDEAQLLSVEFLQPILDVLRLLVQDYGVTLLFSTATQPVLTAASAFDPHSTLRGFAPGTVTEIVDDVAGLYAQLERVRVHLPQDPAAARQWDEIASDVAQHDCALVVVNRRADARDLYRLLHTICPGGTKHLSALMCPQHRSDTIAEVRAALDARRKAIGVGCETEPLRVVSTQLVEAGVDLDFPVVFRAMAGLDSIAQAAGRCNREGRLDRGHLHVFVPPTLPPPGLLRLAERACRAVLHDGPATPLDLALCKQYFRLLYANASLDKFGICGLVRANRAEVAFRDVAERFRLIDDDESATLLVKYVRRGDMASRLDPLVGLIERDGPTRALLRRVQRFGVTLFRHDIERLLAAGDIREVIGCPNIFLQVSDLLYDPIVGVGLDGAPGDPAKLVW